MLAAEGLTPFLAIGLLGIGVVLLALVGWLDHRTEGRPRKDAEWPSSAEERRLMRGSSAPRVVGIDHTGPMLRPTSKRADAPPTRPARTEARPPAAKTKAKAKAKPLSTVEPRPPRVPVAAPTASDVAVAPDSAGPAPAAPPPVPAPSASAPAEAADPAKAAGTVSAEVSPDDDRTADPAREKMPKGADAALDALFGDILGPGERSAKS